MQTRSRRNGQPRNGQPPRWIDRVAALTGIFAVALLTLVLQHVQLTPGDSDPSVSFGEAALVITLIWLAVEFVVYAAAAALTAAWRRNWWRS